MKPKYKVQNKGKESENSYQKFEEITADRHTNTHTETKSKYFDGHGHPSQSEENFWQEFSLSFPLFCIIHISYLSRHNAKTLTE